MSQIINVCLSTDDSFIQHTAAVIASVLENSKKNDKYCFYILTTDLSETNKKLLNYFEDKYSCSIYYPELDKKLLSKFEEIDLHPHLSIATFNRLLIPLIFSDIDKMIYIDSDLIVLGDLSELDKIDVTGFYFAGVKDANSKGLVKKHGYDDKYEYINAGVLIINNKELLKDNYFEKILAAVGKIEAKTGDQDLINYCFHKKIKIISYKWNMYHKVFAQMYKCNEPVENEDYIESALYPHIIHFVGPYKPWSLEYNHPHRKDYIKYLMKTPWAEKANELILHMLDDYSKNEDNKLLHGGEGKITSKAQKRSNIEHILKLKDKYKGERCFIIGGAPSLNALDLKRLENEFTCTVGKGYKLAEKGLKHSNFHVFGDIFGYAESCNELDTNFSDVYFFRSAIDCVNNVKHKIFFDTFERETFPASKGFQYDITKPLYCGHTVIVYALQIMAYLGFEKIYLIGIDLEFSEKEIHAYTSSKEELQRAHYSTMNAKKMYDALRYASDFLKKHNKEVINSSPKKSIDFLPNKNYEELFQNTSSNYDELPKIIVVPAFKEHSINIVFSSDDNYAPYLSVVIKSIIENSSPNLNYDIVILERNISQRCKKLIFSLQDRNNISIRFENVSPLLKNIKFHTNTYFSEETYYRIFIPSIFESYEKVVYLDCDIIVREDIAELFSLNLENNLLAATYNISTYIHTKLNKPVKNAPWRDYLVNVLKLRVPENYFQAGVLVCNLPEMRRQGFQNIALQLAESFEPLLVDQDILNSICQDKVLYFSQQWNLHNNFSHQYRNMHTLSELPESLKNDYLKAKEEPYIVHYAGKEKSWSNPNLEYADFWWHYARMTPFYEEIIYKNNCLSEDLKGNVSIVKQTSSDKTENKSLLFTIYRLFINFYNKNLLKYRTFTMFKTFIKSNNKKRLVIDKFKTLLKGRKVLGKVIIDRERSATLCKYKILGITIYKSEIKDFYQFRHFLGIRLYKKFRYQDFVSAQSAQLKSKMQEQSAQLKSKMQEHSAQLKSKMQEHSAQLKNKIQEQSAQLESKIHEQSAQLENKMRTIVAEESARALTVYNLHQKVFPKYKNIHQGQDVVLVVTGPSLNDYVPIEGAVHIGVNKAFLFDKVNFDYMFTLDYPNITPYIADLNNYNRETCRKFYGIFKNPFDTLHIPEYIVYQADAERFYLEYNDFARDEQYPTDLSTQALASFWTITFQALQFALWTNPKRIYLVGCDESDLGHFNGDMQNLNLATNTESKRQHHIKHMDGWLKLKTFVSLRYPNTEIISINPVGLKEMFKDVFTDKK